MSRRTLAVAIVIASACAWTVSPATAATVTDLKTVHRNGQTFLTFTKNVGSTPKTTYDVYRDTAQITTIAGKTKIATLDADSWHLLYDDSAAATPHLSNGFIISDSGAPLTSAQGLLVWTTAVSGNFYYAVVNSGDRALLPGTNSLRTPVEEAHQEVPGAVLLQAAFVPNGGVARTYRYFRWEDYSTWKEGQWGYYGHRFNAYKPIGFEGVVAPYPIVLVLHAAGFGYSSPGDSISYAPHAVVIVPTDLGLSTPDPYTGTIYGHSLWFGRYDSITGRVYPCTEARITDYVKLVRDDPEFEVDRTRVYVEGASLGSGAMHVASHYPALFAAARTSIGYVDTSGYSGGMAQPQPENTIVGGIEGNPTWEQWEDMKWLADNGYPMPPIMHTYNKDDNTVHPDHYPAALMAFETAKLPFVAKWGGPAPGHAEFYIAGDASGGTWDQFRFKSNEAYPAFANAASSDAFGTAPVASTAPGYSGQRNALVDWGSELHPIGAAIEDGVNSFGVTLKALAADTLADVTIRNAQQFQPMPGDTIAWRSVADGTEEVLQAGSVPADANGLVTIRLRIMRAGNRLVLTCATCTVRATTDRKPGARLKPAAGLPNAPRNVRIVRE